MIHLLLLLLKKRGFLQVEERVEISRPTSALRHEARRLSAKMEWNEPEDPELAEVNHTLEVMPRTGLNQRIFRLNFSIKSGIFTDFSKFFAKFLEFSTNLDIFEHLPEIPTKFHLHFDEK